MSGIENKRWRFLCKMVAAIAVGVLVGRITTVLENQTAQTAQADEQFVNLEYFKEYHQVLEIGDYTFTLTHGLWSEQTHTGACVIEVEKQGGFQGNAKRICGNVKLGVIGDFDDSAAYGEVFHLCPVGDGTLNLKRCKMTDGKLVIYADFESSYSPFQFEDGEYCKNQIYLQPYSTPDTPNTELNPMFVGLLPTTMPIDELMENYGFAFEDDAKGKEYRIADSASLSISYFGLHIQTDHKMQELKVTLKRKKGKDIELDFVEEQTKAGWKGWYGSGTELDGADRRYTYSYTFNKINYNIDKIKAIYVNGEKITD
ncbi:MAG: hypothetical protein NC347_15210 [Clostridium sp.]|nr:hypothetical protein [Clostridium sp.]